MAASRRPSMRGSRPPETLLQTKAGNKSVGKTRHQTPRRRQRWIAPGLPFEGSKSATATEGPPHSTFRPVAAATRRPTRAVSPTQRGSVGVQAGTPAAVSAAAPPLKQARLASKLERSGLAGSR